MSLKVFGYRAALLTALLMTGLVLEPVQASEYSDETEEDMLEEALPHSDEDMPPFEALPEDDGFENLLHVPLEEDPAEPDNVVLVIETEGNVFTQVVYFGDKSADLSEPARMVVYELAAALETFENARITIATDSRVLSGLDHARVNQVAHAFKRSGVPQTWVHLSAPYTLAAAY